MGVSKNRGTPKATILIGFSMVNHPFWDTPIWKHPYKVYTSGAYKAIKVRSPYRDEVRSNVREIVGSEWKGLCTWASA